MIRHYGAAFLVGNAAFACAFAITCGLLAYAFLFFRNAPHSADRYGPERLPARQGEKFLHA